MHLYQIIRKCISGLLVIVLMVPMAVFADSDEHPIKPQDHVITATLTLARNRDLIAYAGDDFVNNFPQSGDHLDIYYEDGHTETIGDDKLTKIRTRAGVSPFHIGKQTVVTKVWWHTGEGYKNLYMGTTVTGVVNTTSNIEAMRFEQITPIVISENTHFGCADVEELIDSRVYQYHKGTEGDRLYIKYSGESKERVYERIKYDAYYEDEFYSCDFVNQNDTTDVIHPGFVDDQEQAKWGPGDHNVAIYYDGVEAAGVLKVTIQKDPASTEIEKDRTAPPPGSGSWVHEWDSGRVLIKGSEGVPGKILYSCIKHGEKCLVTGTNKEDPNNSQDNASSVSSSNKQGSAVGSIANGSKAKGTLFGVRLTKVKKGKKSFTAKWKKASKKQQKKFSGYQIQYSTSPNFTIGVKTKSTTKKKASKVVIRKLKAKTNYYVRIRRFKKSGGKVAYSDWSNVKRVRTK